MARRMTLGELRSFEMLVTWVLAAAAVALVAADGGYWSGAVAFVVAMGGASLATGGGTAWKMYDPPRHRDLAFYPIGGAIVYGGGVWVATFEGDGPWLVWGGAALVSLGLLLIVVAAVRVSWWSGVVAVILLTAGVSVGMIAVHSLQSDQALRGWGEMLMGAALLAAAGVTLLTVARALASLRSSPRSASPRCSFTPLAFSWCRAPRGERLSTSPSVWRCWYSEAG